MTTIKIDARGAGQGKTRTGIYPQITQLHALGESAIIVVPSKLLQYQYQQNLSNINFTLLNSDQGKVSERLVNAINNHDRFILITTEAFRQAVLRFDQKSNYHLIIDEAIMPYSNIEVVMDHQIRLGLDQVFYPKNEIYSHRWNQLSRNPLEACSLLDQSRDWRELTHANNNIWIDYDSWCKFMNGDYSKLYFGIELNPVLLQNWKTVFIAAAAFDRTFMASWLLKNGMTYKTVRPFVPHTQVPVFHTPEKLSYSKNFRHNNPDILPEFFEYVKQTIGQEPCLSVKNNDEMRTIGIETIIGHNAHGLNQYSHYKNIYLVSSLNPTNKFDEFLEDQWHQIDQNQTYAEYRTQAQAGYTYYQLIMRTALRDQTNTSSVNVFLLDTKICISLQNFFDIDKLIQTESQIIPLSQFTPKKVKIKKIPMTAAERNKRARDKKKLLKSNPTTP